MQQSIRFCISASRSSTRDSDAVLYERYPHYTSTTRSSGLRRFCIGPGDWTLSGNCADRLGDVRTRLSCALAEGPFRTLVLNCCESCNAEWKPRISATSWIERVVLARRS